MKVEKYYTSGEFARIANVSITTLLNWEMKGLVKPHHKSPTGRRFYSQEQVDEFFKGDDSSYGKNILKS